MLQSWFFLSGHVVPYAAGKKPEDSSYSFGESFLDRWSRIYSVLLIASGFTLFIGFVGHCLSPEYFNGYFLPQDRQGPRLSMNFFALQGVQGYRIQLGSNPAL
jgi:hypothetical protein